MLINNIDPLISFNAKLIERVIQPADIVTYKDWLRKGLSPVIEAQEEQYIAIHLKFLILCDTDMQAISNISNLISNIKQSTIKFEDLDYYYDAVIKEKTTERYTDGSQGQFTLTVELEAGYAYKPAIKETLNNIASKLLNVSGNLPAPAVVTVTVPVNTISITITGFKSPIIIKNLTANTPVVIDGEACTVLAGGTNKFGDVDMWDFPVLQPGKNTISVDNINSNIDITYKSRWI